MKEIDSKKSFLKRNEINETGHNYNVQAKFSHNVTFISSINPLIWVLILISIGLIWFFYPFLFGDKLLLYIDIGSDSAVQMHPYAEMIKNELKNGLPSWSFQQGLGQFVASFNLGNPFQWIIYLFSGSNTALSFVWVECLKYLASGFFFAYYLKLKQYSKLSIILGGFAYSLNAYVLLTSSWVIALSTWSFTFAFLLFALAYYFRKDNAIFIPFSIFLICADQPFNLLLFAEVSLVYLLLELYLNNSKFYSKKIFKLILYGMLGLGLSSYFIYINAYTMLQSPRALGLITNPIRMENDGFMGMISGDLLQTTIHRLFSNNLTGVGDSYHGWYNYLEAPATYIGLFALLLFTQIFMYATKKMKIAYSMIILFSLLSVLFPNFLYLLWGKVGFYYRIFSLFIAVGLLLGGLTALDSLYVHSKLNIPIFLGTSAFFILLLTLSKNDFTNELEYNKILYFIFLIVIIVLLVKLLNKNWILIFVIPLTFFEMSTHATECLQNRKMLKKREFNQDHGYQDGTKEAIDFINKIDSGFFRIEKNYGCIPHISNSLNDPMVLHYKGTTTYTSFNNSNQVIFMSNLGCLDLKNIEESFWLSGLAARPLLLGNLDVNYFLSRQRLPVEKVGYDSLSKVGNVFIYKNKHVIPFGAGYSSVCKASFFKKLSSFKKDLMLYNALIIEDSSFSKFQDFQEIKDSMDFADFEQIKKQCDTHQQNGLKLSGWNSKLISGVTTNSSQQFIYFSMPWDKGWNAFIDDKKVDLEKINFGLCGIFVEKGHHQIRLEYTVPYLYPFIFMSVFSLFVLITLILLLLKKQRSIRNKKETSLSEKSP